jgi:hypothetical protein
MMNRRPRSGGPKLQGEGKNEKAINIVTNVGFTGSIRAGSRGQIGSNFGRSGPAGPDKSQSAGEAME